MSHYADYVKERQGKLVYECDDGFAVYWYLQHPTHGECVYIEDIYVVPEKRKSGVGAWMADQIAEEAGGRGVTVMLGSVNPQTSGATTSLKVLLGYGMSLEGIQGELIMFSKDI
jgi:GNAT superfamily N-acetyltransferase